MDNACDCCCGILTDIIRLIVYVCFVSLIAWIMFLSKAVKFQIHDAKLTRFDFDLKESNNLHYNLSLNLSIRNSNKLIGIHYDKFQAIVYYGDQRLAAVFVPPFYQGHKNTKDLETLFQGQNMVLFGGKDQRKFEDDREIGVYGIDVKVKIRSRVMLWPLMTWPMKPIIRCHVNVPLLGFYNSAGGFDFSSTKCSLKF